MKSKKNLLKGMLVMLMTLMSLAKVDAKECGEIVAAPHMYQVAPTVRDGRVFNLHSEQETCLGNNTEVWYSSFKSLPNSWTYSRGNLWMELWEEDYSGGDDRVKRYVGFIENKVITEIRLLDIYIANAAIDSVGDNRAELYLTFVSSGQQGLSIEKSLFNYKICMK